MSVTTQRLAEWRQAREQAAKAKCHCATTRLCATHRPTR
jgi:hypothetical protein